MPLAGIPSQKAVSSAILRFVHCLKLSTTKCRCWLALGRRSLRCLWWLCGLAAAR